MKVLQGQQVLMRIFFAEQDRVGSKPLHEAIMTMLRKEKIAGATLMRGLSGFGAKSHLHSAHLLALSQDLPMIIECVDSRENIERIIPVIDEMMDDGLVTLETVEVVRYAPKKDN